MDDQYKVCVSRARESAFSQGAIEQLLEDPGFRKSVKGNLGFVFTHDETFGDPVPEISIGILLKVRDYLEADLIEGWTTILEETSHFCHIHYCLQKYGSKPVKASTELIGCIDKFLNLELIYGNKGIHTH